MANTLDPTHIHTVCTNRECGFYAEVRTVGGQHLGQNLYLTGAITCSCGTTVSVLTDAQATAVDDLEADVSLEKLLAAISSR